MRHRFFRRRDPRTFERSARLIFRFLLAALLLFPSATLADRDVPDPELRRMLIDAVNDSSSFPHRFDAEVWLLDMSRRLQTFVPGARERLGLLRAVHREATRAEIPPELVLAVIEVESRFDRWAISHAGARGLMQVMPFWVKEIGRPEDNLFDRDTNLRYGCTILKYYLDRERGDIVRGLARYNGSAPKTWYSHRVLDALRERWYRS